MVSSRQQTDFQACATRWFGARVVERREQAEGIWSFVLAPAGSEALPPFEAGAHLDLRVGDKIRQYSLCNAPADAGRYEIAIQREESGRGGSREACELLQPGASVMLRGPRNLFPLAAGTREAVLVAGGIGITPLLAMAEELHARATPFALHACARNAARLPFAARMAEAPWREAVHRHLDDAPAPGRMPLAAIVGAPAESRHLYVCGPAGFVAAVTAAAQEQAWPAANVHVERFSAEPLQAGDNRALTVEIRSTGQLIEVPADVSVAVALEEAGIEILRSCNEGFCGTCLTGVLAGVPDHRDVILTEEERAGNRCFTPCCSRALSDLLVLDL
jgi:vanillate monooxygenase ferredoxin subunit